MSKQARSIIIALIIAILLHASILLTFIKFDSDKNHIGGLTGDINRITGSTQENHIPIKISTVEGDVEDARQIIARRRKTEQQAQAAQEAKKATQNATSDQENKNPKTAKSPDTEDQTAQEAEKQKDSINKATVSAKNKGDKEKKEKKKSVTKAKSDSESRKKTKNHTTQNATTAAQAQKAQVQRNSQTAHQKASTQHIDNKNSMANQATNIFNGDGGGDGAKFDDYSADDAARFKQRVQTIVRRNFSVNNNSHFNTFVCRISVHIGRDGTLSIPEVIEGEPGSKVCISGLQAITKTNRIPAPGDSYYNEVEYINLYFRIDN